MALPRVGRLDPDEAEAFVSKVLVDEAVRQPSPDGAAHAAAADVAGLAGHQEGGQPGLAELTDAGIYPPDWVTGPARRSRPRPGAGTTCSATTRPSR